MPRGSPDYGLPDYSFFTVETPVSDVVSERQGFSRLDNRGRVLWFDDFRNGISRWRLSNDAGGIDPIHTIEAAKSVGFHGSVKYSPLVNGGVSGMDTNLLLPVAKKLGIEFCIYMHSNFGQFEISLQHSFVDGTGKAIILDILHQTGEIRVRGALDNLTIATPSSVGHLVDRWVSMKLVGNFETGYYERAMIGNNQYDLSSLSLISGLAGFSGSIYVDTFAEGRTAVFKEPCYLGYVIISGDEP